MPERLIVERFSVEIRTKGEKEKRGIEKREKGERGRRDRTVSPLPLPAVPDFCPWKVPLAAVPDTSS
jgi:hypothetical protein